jgi:putative ABC transport system permease protein
VVGADLARKFGWKVGDRITLTGTIYPGDWPFNVDGIYTVSRKSLDQSSMWFHWDYLNDSIKSERRKDQVGWIASRLDDATRSAAVAAAIDKAFDDEDIQTLSQSEREMQTSFLGMLSAILKAVNVISLVILVIMMLILGNTIAMGVRERTSEYSVLRAIGFLPRHIASFVLGEAASIGLLGGLTGLGLAYLLIDGGTSRFIEENFGSMFPFFRIDETTIVAALACAVVLGVVAAFIPAWRASRLDVIEGLRRTL